jgi:hypothetical protein
VRQKSDNLYIAFNPYFLNEALWNVGGDQVIRLGNVRIVKRLQIDDTVFDALGPGVSLSVIDITAGAGRLDHLLTQIPNLTES